MEKVITLHHRGPLTAELSQTDGFMAPCLTSSFTNLLGKLPMAKVLLPLANLGVNMESEVVEDMRVVGVFRELE